MVNVWRQFLLNMLCQLVQIVKKIQIKYICGGIKQNEPEVVHMAFLVLFTHIVVSGIFNITFS